MLGKDLPPSQLYSLDSQFHQNKIYVHCKYRKVASTNMRM